MSMTCRESNSYYTVFHRMLQFSIGFCYVFGNVPFPIAITAVLDFLSK